MKLAFASATGIRAGELHALRWHHLDFAKGEVKVETRVDAYGDEDVTKTAAGMRTIPCRSHSFSCSSNGRFAQSARRPMIWSFQT